MLYCIVMLHIFTKILPPAEESSPSTGLFPGKFIAVQDGKHRVCPVKQTCSLCLFLFSCLHQSLSYKMMQGLLANCAVCAVKDYTGSALPPSVEGPTTKIRILIE